MGKRKKGHPSIEDVLDRPWCYYCERDFDDLKILISHQKAKHFKCDRCGRRLNTAGGLSVHLNQVHKEQLTSVENALPNRQGLEVEIFGMEGIPDDVMQTHNTRVMQQYYEAAAERRAKSGNLMPGEAPKRKKIKLETEEELKDRFKQWRENGGETIEINPAPAPAPVPASNSPAVQTTPFGQPPAMPNAGFNQPGFPQQMPGQPGFPPTNPYTAGQIPPGMPFPGAPVPFSGSPVAGGPAGLPPRPGFPGLPGQFPGPAAPFAGGNATAAAVDDLIASVTGQGAKADDKKGKKEKDKNTRLVYSDNEMSPEERLATSSKYAFTV